MTTPRKNPVLPSLAPTLPPARRTRTALGLLPGAAIGVFELQHCLACGAVQYPPRDACAQCVSTDLHWRPADGAGTLLSETQVRHSQELYFRERGPWRAGLIRLNAGVSVIAHLTQTCPPAPSQVRVTVALDRAGNAVLVAGMDGGMALADDSHLRDLTGDPRGRKALVTDAKSRIGQAAVRALLDAGCSGVWAGHCNPWIGEPGWDAVQILPGVTPVPLDPTDGRSVDSLAGELGFKVDILINTSQHQRHGGLLGQPGIDRALSAMDVNCFGLMRLAKAFAPVLRARGADGALGAVAWVNVLSVTALTPDPEQAEFAASMAASLSVAQSLRASLQPGGIRVINVFPGPIDDAWNQTVLPPKLAPAALARAIVTALRGSVEDVFPGDIAQDWLARYRDNPKALEREAGR